MTDDDRDSPAPRLVRVVAAAAVAFGLGAALASAWHQGETYDEPAHLAWSRRLLETGETERTSVLHYNSKTPVSVLNVLARQGTRRILSVRDPQVLRFASRVPNVAWLAVLLVAVFRLSRPRLGETAACLATTAAALDPNLIANAAIATVDVPYAAATLLVWWAALRWTEVPSGIRGAVLGLALGLAFLVKFTAFLLVPAVVVLPLAIPALRRPLFARPARTALSLGVALATTLLVIAAGYRFRDFGVSLNDVRWTSPPLYRLWLALPHLRLPFPADFLTGLDILLVTGTKEWPVLLFGRNHPGGVWFYFLGVWLVKEPIVLLAFQLAGVARGLLTRLVCRHPMLLYLGVNVLGTLAYFSLLVTAQIGIRFVLPCLPAVDILAAAALAALSRTRVGGRALAVLALVAAGVQVPYLGNHLAFTSDALWPKRNAFRWLADSNIDYGQNDERVETWREARGLRSAWLDPVHALPGENLFSLNRLAGVGKFEQHRWLREHASAHAHLGYTYFLFTVDGPLYERLLEEDRHLRPGPDDAAWCRDAPAAGPVADGAELTLPDLGPGEALVLCVTAPERVDVGLHGAEGTVVYGAARDRARDHPMVAPQLQSWYRLEPGTSALVAQRSAGFRGRWETRAPLTLALVPARVDKGTLLPAR
jgi:hypothetical protein